MQHLGQHDCAWWLHAINLPAVTAGVPTRTGAGFVNAAADLLQHLGALLQPHLPLLASLALRLLQSSLPSAAPQVSSTWASAALPGDAYICSSHHVSFLSSAICVLSETVSACWAASFELLQIFWQAGVGYVQSCRAA